MWRGHSPAAVIREPAAAGVVRGFRGVVLGNRRWSDGPGGYAPMPPQLGSSMMRILSTTQELL